MNVASPGKSHVGQNRKAMAERSAKGETSQPEAVPQLKQLFVLLANEVTLLAHFLAGGVVHGNILGDIVCRQRQRFAFVSMLRVFGREASEALNDIVFELRPEP